MSWVEVLMVLAVLVIISAVAVPKLVGISNQSQQLAQSEALDAVKLAFAVSIQENQQFPDVIELSQYVDADGVLPVDRGIKLSVSGDSYTILTYSDAECRTTDRTAATTDTVRCIGDIVRN